MLEPIITNYRIPQNTVAGHTYSALISPVGWITDLKHPPLTLVNQKAGDSVIITESHEWATDKGAIHVLCAPKSVEVDGELVGDDLGKGFKYSPKIIIPGDTPALYETILGIINEPLIMFLKSGPCNNLTVYQFGCDEYPGILNASTLKSGKNGEGRREYSITMEVFSKYWYKGAITELPD